MKNIFQTLIIISLVLCTSGAMAKQKVEPLTMASAQAIVYDTKGRVKDYIPVDGTHKIWIHNDSDDYQTYFYTVELVCDNFHDKKTESIMLAPYTSTSFTKHTKIFVKHEWQGNWRADASTSVSGQSYAHGAAHAIVRAHDD